MVSLSNIKKKSKKVRKYLLHDTKFSMASVMNMISNIVGRTSLGDTNLEYLNTLDTYQLALMNPIVGSCIRAKCNKILGLRWELKPNDPEHENDSEKEYLEDLFNNPHGITDNTDFTTYLESWVRNYELTGNAFVEIQYSKNNSLSEISALNIIDTEDLTYDTTFNQFCLKDNNQILFDQFHLVQSKNRDVFNPKEVFGYSKLEEINKQMKVMLIGLDYNTKTLVNGGINPRTVFSFPADMSRDDFFEELALFNKMSEKANEEGKKHTIAMKGVEVQTTGVNNSDMEFKDLYYQCVMDICACLGVPPSIIGIVLKNDSKFDKYTFNEGIMSLINVFERVHNTLLKNLGYSYHIKFERLDTKDILAMTEMFDKLSWNGMITPNEARAELDLPPVPWGDKPFNNNYNRKAKNFGTLQNNTSDNEEED